MSGPTVRAAAPTRPTAPPTPQLRDHMLKTYHSMRLGIGIAGVLLPWVLWIGGCLRGAGPLQPSMSAYYHTVMRDVFVAVLAAIGFLLFLYKGFSREENHALNAGGLLAIGVALLPTARVGVPADAIARLHATCAVSFFACIAYVAIFRAADTLSLEDDHVRVKHLRIAYRVLGICMVAFPVLAVVLSNVLQGAAARTVFFVEAAGVVAFSAFWFVKSLEMRKTQADTLAAEGKLQAIPPRTILSPTYLIREEPGHARAEMEAELRRRRRTQRP